MKRDPFGLARLYYTERDRGSSIRELFARRDLPRTLDPIAVAAHFAGEPATDRTMFAAIRAVPPGHELVPAGEGFVTQPYELPARPGELAPALRAAMAAILGAAPRPVAVALSGGLDSAIVLALARELEPQIEAIVLAPVIAGYGELDAALATARSLGTRARVVEVSARDIVAALPAAIAAMEVPLYNLHPVAKWLLACAARDAGIATVISGDGIDQVFARDVSADYLPLVGAAFDAAGVALRTPFLDDDVIARVLALPPDPTKRALREVGATLPVPQALVAGPKVSRLAPPLELAAVVAPGRLVQLARMIDRELVQGDDRARVRWTTLALLVDLFEGSR